MTLPLYQVDAFSDSLFGGNPACIVPLDDWLPVATMLQIAKENAVAETAFFIIKEDHVALRWFTPEIEMDLCGHATLATAHVLKQEMDYNEPILFKTASGDLPVAIENDLYVLNLPSRPPEPAKLPIEVSEALSIQPTAVFMARDYVLLYETEQQVKDMVVDQPLLDRINLDPGGVIVTAAGSDCDFVSRFFTPQASILEDPVTGSAHCSLIPFWADRLGKTEMLARQLSERGGTLYCTLLQDRVLVKGHARTYFSGDVFLPLGEGGRGD